MSPPLETYLNRIKAHLKGIPSHEQELHLQEVAQHLQTLIAAKMLKGLSQEEAINSALQQFGAPHKIGRGIQQATGGTKTHIILGLTLGAAAGCALLIFFWVWPVLFGVPYNPRAGLGSSSERLAQAALSGALASLVGRRFTRRYLTRPARSLPIFTPSSYTLTLCARLAGVGILRGAVGGAVYGALNITFALFSPYSTATLVSVMVRSFVIWTVVHALFMALLVGFLSAIMGALLGVLTRRSSSTYTSRSAS